MTTKVRKLPKTNPHRNSRCQEARVLISDLIHKDTDLQIAPRDIKHSSPKKGLWRVTALDQDWPDIILSAIKRDDLSLIKRCIDENKVKVHLREDSDEIEESSEHVENLTEGHDMEETTVIKVPTKILINSELFKQLQTEIDGLKEELAGVRKELEESKRNHTDDELRKENLNLRNRVVILEELILRK